VTERRHAFPLEEDAAMPQLKEALQFVFLSVIARLFGYIIVRVIELFQPRSIHFVIAPTVEEEDSLPVKKVPSAVERRKAIRKQPGQGENKVFHARQWVRVIKLKVIALLVAAGNRLSRAQKTKGGKIPIKLITEIVGLVTAVVSLVILLLDYFL
jgi:hypothetical protein